MKSRPKRSTPRARPPAAPRPVPKRPAGPPRERRAAPPTRDVLHVAPVDVLAAATVEIASVVEHRVLVEHKRADRTLAVLLRDRRDLAPPDHRFISQSVFALFRWRGWVEPLKQTRPEERLLLAWLFDAPTVHPVCRFWAQRIGRDPSRLVPLGDAPNWTARAEGLKRWVGGRAVTADPWRLFPAWLREHLPLPPGNASPKARYLDLLSSLQSQPPLWVRAQGEEAKPIWAELAESGLKPWVHRRLDHAARLGPESDVHHLPAFERGALEIQDLAAQAVGHICDPDPGERWWDACAGAGGKALHLAALMKGKGVVVATDTHAVRLKEAVRRARRSPFRNVTTKPWDGKHVAGKPRSFDGVLVDAPCSAIGTWRRNPDARWTLDREAIPRLAGLQQQLLAAASAGVRPGGTLVYSVCTMTPAETMQVVQAFLAQHPDFQLDPFAHPIDESQTPGTVLIWPQDADSDAMFVARMIRKA